MIPTHTALGIALTVTSAVLYNVGFVVEKGALNRLPAVHARRLGHLLRTVLSSPRWLAGFAAILVGLGLQVVALTLVPISVVQPIFVSGIVVLLVLSHVTLGERLQRREWVGIVVVAVALLAISLSLDPHSDRAGTHGTLAALLAIGVPTVAAGLWLFATADRAARRAPGRRDLGALLYGSASGLVYGVAALATKAVATEVQAHGLFTGVPWVLRSPAVYIVAGASAVGLVLFQTALQRCPASVVVPVSNVVSSAYVVAVGTILFAERLPVSDVKAGLRVAGFVGVLAGIVILAGAGADVSATPPPGPVPTRGGPGPVALDQPTVA